MEEFGKKTQIGRFWLSTLSAAAIDSVSLHNLIVSSVAAATILWMPYQKDAAGNRLPTVIFRGQPYSFQAFVLLVMFGFSTSFSALYSYNRPELARFLSLASAVFLSSAASVLLFAISIASVFKPSTSAYGLWAVFLSTAASVLLFAIKRASMLLFPIIRASTFR